MTAQEFINIYNTDHENSATDEQKLRWLKRLEMTVMSDVIFHHNDYDRSGMLKGTVFYSENDLDVHIDGTTLDISKMPEMYIDGETDTLILTGYEPTKGSREADNFGPDTMLQIPEPYDDVYEYYLDQRIAHVTGNTKDYNTASALFNEAYAAFKKYYHRTHRSNHQRSRLLRHEVL